MNGLGRNTLRIGCGLAAAAVSFTLTLHFTGAPVTYSKFASRAGNGNNAFTMDRWVTNFNVVLVFSKEVSSVAGSVYESVYHAVYNGDGSSDGILYVYLTLPEDFDPSSLDLSTVKLELNGNQVNALSFDPEEGGVTIAFDWNTVAAWLEDSGQDSISAAISGKSSDGYFAFSGTGTINWDLPTIIR